MSATIATNGERCALVTAELIRVGVGFEARKDPTKDVWRITAAGRGELLEEIARVVSERLLRAQAYTTEQGLCTCRFAKCGHALDCPARLRSHG